MELILNTWTIPDVGTFGELRHKTVLLARTVERDWLNNKPSVSCIPAGEYILSSRYSIKHKDHYILESPHLGVGHDAGIRTHILIHVANWPDEVSGCIGVGRNWMKDSKGHFLGGVTSSVATMTELRQRLGTKEKHTLIIKRS